MVFPLLTPAAKRLVRGPRVAIILHDYEVGFVGEAHGRLPLRRVESARIRKLYLEVAIRVNPDPSHLYVLRISPYCT